MTNLQSMISSIKERLSTTEDPIKSKFRQERKECQGCLGVDCHKFCGEKYWQPQEIVDGRIVYGWCKAFFYKEFSQRCRAAGISKYAEKTFEDYEVEDEETAKAVKLAKWFLDNNKAWLYFYGDKGTGKTFLVSLIARGCILRNKRVTLVSVLNLLSEVKNAFNDPTKDSVAILNRYCNCPLLILDDIGAGQITDWSVNALLQIIDSRYANLKPTILTSNYDLKRLEVKLKFDEGRIVSRLKEKCALGFLKTVRRRSFHGLN